MKTGILIAGDILMLILFAFMGQSEHKTLTTLGGTLETAAPFIIAWLLISVITGLYKMHHYQSFSSMFKRTLIVWLIAIPAGLGLRALYYWKGIPLPFFIVGMISTFILLFSWRFLFVWLNKRQQS